MQGSKKTTFALGVLAAGLWSPHFHVVNGLAAAGVPLPVVHFHLVLWAAAGLFLILFLSGDLPELSIFNRRQTRFLVLAAVGGFGLWLLRAQALTATSPSRFRLMFYCAPLLIALLSVFTRERASFRNVVGLLAGLVGCAVIVVWGQTGAAVAGTTSTARGTLCAVGAAACWAIFTLAVRPVVSGGKALPVAFLVLGIGAACLLASCLSTRQNVFGLTSGQLLTTAVTGFFTVGVMMVCWLKCLRQLPATAAAPFWYLGVLFGLLWGGRAGMSVSFWWALLGAAVMLLGIHTIVSARARVAVTMSDVIRGWGRSSES